MEGPTERTLYEDVLGVEDPDVLQGVTVKEMPDYLRAAKSSPSDIAGLLKVLNAAIVALTPFGVRALFLFDRDETTEARRQAVIERSGGAVAYQPCREIENLLLHEPSISSVLNKRREQLGLAEVSAAEVSRRINDLLADVRNGDLYPGGASEPDPCRVRASRLLTDLFASFDAMYYDKVRDGRAIGAEILKAAPQSLQPLREALAALRGVALAPGPPLRLREATD